MLKAECPYIPPRFGTAGEADVLHASPEDALVRLLSLAALLLLLSLQQQRWYIRSIRAIGVFAFFDDD
jgi:flagellar biosynthesis protein FliR